MSLCDTRKAMRMGATNVEKRSLKTKHLAPIFRAELITDDHANAIVLAVTDVTNRRYNSVALLLRNRLVQIQQHAGDRCPPGKLSRSDALGQ